MLRSIFTRVIILISLMPFYGCALLVAGAAGRAGTAVWLSNKLVQGVNASFDKSVNATKSAFKSLKMEVTKETTTDEVVQLISQYHDGRKVWVDIHKVSLTTSRIEVRVGLVGDEKAAREVLDKILKFL